MVSDTTPIRRPLSLAPTSPFLNPFESPIFPSHSPITPSSSSTRRSSSISLDSPASSVTASPTSPGQVRVAYIARRDSEDLLNVLDLSPVLIRQVKAGSKMSEKKKKAPVSLLSSSQPPHISTNEPDARPGLTVDRKSTSILIPASPKEQAWTSPLPNSFLPSKASGSPLPPLSDATRSLPAQVSEQLHDDFIPETSERSTIYSELSSVPSSAGALQRRKVMQQYPGVHQTLHDMQTLYEDQVDMSNRRSLPPKDQSFFRFSMSTASDGSAPVYLPRTESRRSKDDADIEELSSRPASGIGSLPHLSILRRESTVSGNTFGSRRRWSTHLSSVGSGAPPHERASSVPISKQPPDHRRPTSMSSSSTGTGSAPSRVYQQVPGYLASSAQTHQHHRRAESDASIQAHLLNLASKSQRHIVPSPGTFIASPLAGPPSSGTPLNGGGVPEESQSSESDLGSYPRSPRAQGKLDRVLGQGAETARKTLQSDNRAMESVLEISRNPGPVPPHRKSHKASHSVPADTKNSIRAPEDHSASPPGSGGTPKQSLEQDLPATPRTPDRPTILDELHRFRSGSLDSLPSLNPSINDSVHTLARLLPSPSHKGLPPLPTRSELDPEQRLRLLHRARKLQQVLGESLNEQDIERLVVEPHTIGTTILTHFSEEYPPHSVRIPEWDREDCLPQTVMEPSARPNLNRQGSAIAKKARAALGFEKSKEEESDLKVYVKREMQVSETNLVPKQTRVTRGTGSQRKPPSPASPADTVLTRWEGDGEDGGEEATTRRLRRLQLVKLQRLLGVPIPASLIGSNSTDDLPSSSSFPASSPAPNHSRSNSSFIDLAEPRSASPSPASWANKIKQGMSIRERKPKFMSDSSSSFLDMRGSPASAKSASMGSIEGMSEGEKTAARRKAHKLEQVFGDTPPQDMFLSSSHSHRRPPIPLRQTSSESKIPVADQTPTSSLEHPLSSYTQSIEGLLYLAENDHSRFAELLDSLDPSSSSCSPPPSPTPSVKSHAARRRRTGKLSHFFGETGVDFDNPNPQTHQHQQQGRGKGEGQGKVPIALVKKRRETLDSVLGELWRGLQGELRRGRATRGDVDRLGEMVGVLRRTRNGWEEL